MKKYNTPEERREHLLEYIKTELGDSFSLYDVRKEGYYYTDIMKLIDENIIKRYCHGVYQLTDSFEDEYSLLQQKYSKGVYSNMSALYLLGYSDRIPNTKTMTFPYGYNSKTIKEEKVKVKHSSKDNYDLGLIETKTVYGNNVKTYNIERTLCDLLYGNRGDLELINKAFRNYVYSSSLDVNKLEEYADRLHVRKKVDEYLRVLL